MESDDDTCNNLALSAVPPPPPPPAVPACLPRNNVVVAAASWLACAPCTAADALPSSSSSCFPFRCHSLCAEGNAPSLDALAQQLRPLPLAGQAAAPLPLPPMSPVYLLFAWTAEGERERESPLAQQPGRERKKEREYAKSRYYHHYYHHHHHHHHQSR